MNRLDEQVPSRRLNTRAPRWVKAFAVAGIILVLVFVMLHIAGLGLGGHMHHVP